MTGKWQVFRQQRAVGPFTTDQLRRFLANGQLNQNDMVRPMGHQDWQTVASIAASLAEPQSPPLPPSIHRSRRPSGLPSAELPAVPGRPSQPPSVAGVSGPPNRALVEVLTLANFQLCQILMWVAVATCIVLAFSLGGLPLLDAQGQPVDAQERPITLTPINIVSLLGFLISELTNAVSETLLMYFVWNALPKERRPLGMHAGVAVGLAFVPLFAYGWYFVAYGLLGLAWWKTLSHVDSESAQSVKILRWLGFGFAALTAFVWIMYWIDQFVVQPWWNSPLVSQDAPIGVGRNRGRINVLRLFSLHSIFLFVRAWGTFLFYSAILDTWQDVSRQHGSDMSAPA